MSITWGTMNIPDGINASNTTGTYMKLGIKSDETTAHYYEIKGIQSIPGLGSSVNTVECTTFADDTRRHIKGIKDSGNSLTVKIVHEARNFKFLKSLETEGKKFTFQVQFPDTTGTGESAVQTVAQFCAFVAVGPDDTSTDALVTDSLNLVIAAPESSGDAVIDFSKTAWVLT